MVSTPCGIRRGAFSFRPCPFMMPEMEPADSIARLGFARWYERRLIE